MPVLCMREVSSPQSMLHIHVHIAPCPATSIAKSRAATPTSVRVFSPLPKCLLCVYHNPSQNTELAKIWSNAPKKSCNKAIWLAGFIEDKGLFLAWLQTYRKTEVDDTTPL